MKFFQNWWYPRSYAIKFIAICFYILFLAYNKIKKQPWPSGFFYFIGSHKGWPSSHQNTSPYESFLTEENWSQVFCISLIGQEETGICESFLTARRWENTLAKWTSFILMVAIKSGQEGIFVILLKQENRTFPSFSTLFTSIDWPRRQKTIQ